jgi:amino acid transporter
LTVVNIIGVRNAAMVSNVSAVAKLTPLALLVAAGCFFVDPARYTLGTLPTYSAFSSSVLLLVYAFTGFEMVAIPGGEQRDPKRDLPYALLVGMAIVIVVYVLIQFVAVGTLPELASSRRPLSDAGARVLGQFGGAIIACGALLSLFGNLNVILLVAPRLPFAMAERGELPRFIASTHRRFHTPHAAIALTAALMLALTLSGTFIYAATVSTLARLVGYATTCLALPVLRRRPDTAPARFLAPAGGVVAVVALILVVWLVTNSTAAQARDAGIAAVLGLLIYTSRAGTNAGRPRES